MDMELVVATQHVTLQCHSGLQRATLKVALDEVDSWICFLELMFNVELYTVLYMLEAVHCLICLRQFAEVKLWRQH